MRVRARVGCVLASALAVAATLPAPALGHEGNPDYRSEITGLDPSAPGVSVEVLNYDDSLLLRNEGGETVVVYGYEGEPYVRIGPDGTVEVNERSPSYFLNKDRFAETSVPESADDEAPPEWLFVDDSGQYAWHDHRSHYMGSGVPQQVSDEGEQTKVFDYEIPLQVGSTNTMVTGTLYWVGRDSGAPIAALIALAVVALAAIATALVVRRRRSGAAGHDEERPTDAGEAW